MTLKKDLDEIKSKLANEMSDEAKKISSRAIKDLADSGIAERSLLPGDRAPDRELPDSKKVLVKFQDLIAKGPVVLSFYRGGW